MRAQALVEGGREQLSAVCEPVPFLDAARMGKHVVLCCFSARIRDRLCLGAAIEESR